MNSFLRKVEAERNILSVVNIHTNGKGQLTGLSGSAIKNWCSFHNVSANSKVSRSLRSLADLCNSLSDRSNENFVRIPTERLLRIKTEMSVLKNTLEVIFSERA